MAYFNAIFYNPVYVTMFLFSFINTIKNCNFKL